MIRFKKVELHNYGPFKDAVLNMDKQGLVLIEGKNHSNNAYQSNGSGKSNLLGSVTYALYGRTVEGHTGDSIVNNKVGKDCYVYLWFSKDDSEYKIERYRKGKKGNANKVKLFADGKEITTSRASLTNKAIEDLLGIDFGTYVNTISYGQGDVPIFSQATDKGKKEILENLANISIYEKAQEIAKNDLAGINLNITQQSKNIESLNSRKELINKYIADATSKLKEIAKSKEEDKRTLEASKVQLSTTTEDLKAAKLAHKDALDKLNSYKLNNKMPSTTELTNKVQELYTKYSSNSQKASQLKSSIQDMVTQLKNTSNAKLCPVCGQPLDQEHRAKELARLKKQINDYLLEYKKHDKEAKESIPEYNQAKSQVDTLDKKVSAIYSQLQALQSIESQASQAVNELEYQYKLIKDKIKALSSKTYDLSQPNYDKDIKEIDEQLVDTQNKLDDNIRKRNDYQILVDNVFSRKGVSSVALDFITPFLTDRTNYYLSKLSGSIIQVNMSTQTLNANNTLADRFDIQVENESGANDYQSCSTGERKRIDIAISFAIQDLQNSKSNMATNMAIYDECFDGLDAIGAETVIDLLKEKSKEISSIFVITHNDTLKPFFDSVITVDKGKDGIARIVGDNDED